MDMLSSIVDNINSPEMIYGKIGDLGGMHYRLGVRAVHMPIMKEALFRTLADAAPDLFTAEVQAAWTYVWDYMTVAMAQTLEDEGSTLTLVMDSWEIIAETKTARELGELLYDYLFSLVPNVRNMFTKSREEMAIKMGDALEMIISCAENPGSLQDQLRFLGLRHVTYKVHPHHIPLMGPPLLSVLAEQLGGEWTSEGRKTISGFILCFAKGWRLQEGCMCGVV
jgi:hemoglobin-like flavoprotein